MHLSFTGTRCDDTELLGLDDHCARDCLTAAVVLLLVVVVMGDYSYTETVEH